MKRDDTATVQLKLRLREKLRRKLEKAAEERDSSINQEMNRRLEESFIVGDLSHAVTALANGFMGGSHTANLVRQIVAAISLGESITGKNWSKDEGARTYCRTAIAAILKELMPSPLHDGNTAPAVKVRAEEQRDAKRFQQRGLLAPSERE